MFFSSLVTEDDWDVVKTYSLSEVWASLTYGRRHPAELVDENEGQIKADSWEFFEVARIFFDCQKQIWS